MLPLQIVILEDNLERKEAMQSCLADRFPQYETRFFDTSAELIYYLREHLGDTLILSLDHDLELKVQKNGKVTDCGTGRDVADFLIVQPPVCPVVIHSTNATGVQGMEMAFQDAHWRTYRVTPWGDLEWIPKQWFPTMRRAILDTARKPTIEKT